MGFIVIHDITDVAIWAGAIVPLLFVVQYTYLSRWWRSPVGRMIVALDACLFVVMALLAAQLAGAGVSAIGFLGVEAVALLGVPVVIVWRMAVWERLRRKRQRELIEQLQAQEAARLHWAENLEDFSEECDPSTLKLPRRLRRFDPGDAG